MHVLLQQLGDAPDAETLARFIAEHDFPLIDERGATFIFHGQADAVYLQHWAFALPNPVAFKPLAQEYWAAYLELEPGSRLEYKIEAVRNGHGEWMADPLNPLLAHDPFGANSVCQAYGYERPEWTLPDPNVPAGCLESFSLFSQALVRNQTITLYLPAGLQRRQRYPLLIAHDGEDYLNYSQLQTVLDNLIAAKTIQPLIVAMTQAEERKMEYAGDPRHAHFIALELLPVLRQRLPLRRARHALGLMGASLGAVASLHTAWRYPGQFGKLLLQSGSFAATDVSQRERGPTFEPVIRFVDAFRREPGQPAEKIYMSCGLYETLVVENRAMDRFLRQRNLSVQYQESYDGHNWENWRDHLRDGLSWLFPPSGPKISQ